MKIHPSSDVQSVKIGEGTQVWQYCVILSEAEIGKQCKINFNVFIENDVKIGDRVTIKPGVCVWDGVTLEDDVFVGPNAVFTNDLLPRSNNKDWQLIRTTVKKGASIGANATIVAGVTIGEYAMIGAGSVVTCDIPPRTLWYGNPARLRAHLCECGNKLNSDHTCSKCHKTYQP